MREKCKGGEIRWRYWGAVEWYGGKKKERSERGGVGGRKKEKRREQCDNQSRGITK